MFSPSRKIGRPLEDTKSYCPSKKRRVLTLQIKLDIIEKFENGATNSKISQDDDYTLLELDDQRAFEEKEMEAEELEVENKELSTDQLVSIVTKANELCDLVSEDPDTDDSFKCRQAIKNITKKYKDKLEEKPRQKTVQTSLRDYFNTK